MALTTEGIDKAEIAVCVELDGRFERLLPWAFVTFADAGEERRWVMPASQGLHVIGGQPYRQTREAMRNRAFPHELDFGPKPSSGDLSKEGPRAVHFFGVGV